MRLSCVGGISPMKSLFARNKVNSILYAAFMRGQGLFRNLTLFLVSDDFLEETCQTTANVWEYI